MTTEVGYPIPGVPTATKRLKYRSNRLQWIPESAAYVDDYGATGDGSTDDYTAIAAAITAAGVGGTVVFPKPSVSYLVGTALVPLNYQTWMSPGGGIVTGANGYPMLRAKSTFAGFLVTVSGTLDGWTCKGLAFYGRGAVSGSGGISIATGHRNRIEHCWFDQMGESAVTIGAGYGNVLARSFAQNCLLVRTGRADYVGVVDLSSTDDFVSENEITSSSSSIAASGFIVAYAARGANSFYANNIAEISEAGWYISCSRSRFVGCRADLNRGHGWVIVGTGNQFVGCLGLNNGQETTNTYSNFQASSASAGNLFSSCLASDILTAKCKYGFEDLVASSTAKNTYVSPASTTAVTAQFIGASNNASAFFFPRGATKTLTANSTTPDVSGYENFLTANSSPTTITAFIGGVAGQRLTILCNDANTTIQHNGSTITLAGAGNKKLRSGQHYEFVFANNTAIRELTAFPLGVTADVGNLAKTLQSRVNEETQIWNTALTADRAVTLSTTGAYAGATFRIVRTAAATGAFNLNVGTGPLKALAVGTWCDVTYDGSAWVLTGYGAL